MHVEDLEISDRFCGPPGAGHGGYVCGRVAKGLAGTVAVRLRAPAPLNTALRRQWTPNSARLLHGTTVIAEARAAELVLEPPDPPDVAAARHAAESCPGLASHVFPRCFVCGPERGAGDGLRIFPGPLAGGAVHAAPWTPGRSLESARGKVAPEFVWAALDCPGAFAVLPLAEGTAIVLGELCASLHAELEVGETVLVSSWPVSREGRRRVAGSAVHTAGGRLVALARALWIEVPANLWTGGS